MEYGYLKWMAENTDTQWCNDSAIPGEIMDALRSGATGCTSNPPLSYLSLVHAPELFQESIEKIPADVTGNQRALALMGVVVRHISGMLYPLYQRSEGRWGYVRAQVQPTLSQDGPAMVAMGRTIASWAENIMVKIPATAAGIWALEELAAVGIPTTPTVCVSVAQIMAAAQANERGARRAQAAGLPPAPSTCAIVMGRLQDYLTALNEQRGAGLTFYDLECAALAVAKRSYQVLTEGGYRQRLMPAAFRSARQIAQLAGADGVMTIHPLYQRAVAQAEEEGAIERRTAIDEPVDPDALRRVEQALPEFTQAYAPDGLLPGDFAEYGATVMTLENFNATGWQKLLTL